MSAENVEHAVEDEATAVEAPEVATAEPTAAAVAEPTAPADPDALAESPPADDASPAAAATDAAADEAATAAATDAAADGAVTAAATDAAADGAATAEVDDAAAAPPEAGAPAVDVPPPAQEPQEAEAEAEVEKASTAGVDAAVSEAAAPSADVEDADTDTMVERPDTAPAETAAEAPATAEEERSPAAPQTTDTPPAAPLTEDDGVDTASLVGATSARSAVTDAAASEVAPQTPPSPQPTATAAEAAAEAAAAPAVEAAAPTPEMDAAAAPAAAPPAPAPAPATRPSKTHIPQPTPAPVPAQPQRPTPQQPQQPQQPPPPAPAPRPVASSFHGVATSSAIASAAMAPYMADAAPSADYAVAEAERVAMAAASLTPNTVLAVFRRGHENSHVNRMDLGSYSRYLLATDRMPAVVLDSTFHGEAATVGTVPRNTLNASGRGRSSDSGRQDAASRTPSRGRSPSPQHSGRLGTASTTSPRRAEAFPRPVSSLSAEGRPTSSGIFTGTMASSTVNVRRELTMVQDATLTDLNAVRQLRRRDPRHGKTTAEQDDYYYYNHRSKGYYVPHDPPAHTVMMQYNHMYSFGDGTRFASRPPGSRVLDVVPHPHAAPPRTFAETRGSAFPFTASQRLGHSAPASASVRSRSGKPASSWGSAQSQRGAGARSAGSGAAKGSSSLRTAKAVDLGRLHCTQCPRPRSIEEVMADQPQQYLCSADGVRGPLVHDIERDVEDGKLQWTEVPGSMRHAMATATSSAAAVSARYSQPAATPGHPASAIFAGTGRTGSTPPPQHRAGSLATAPNALENVMGQVRAVSAIAAASAAPHGTGGAKKTLSTAPPSPAAASVRAAGGDRDSEVAESTAAAAAARRGPHAAALPAISRLNYTPQPTRRSNPSAFV